MRKIKAFTLIEVMISIFIFTTAMLGYMAFHAYSMSVLFDNESAQFAHSLAFNLVDEVNAMSYDSFKSFVEGCGCVGDSATKKDSAISSTLFGSNFKAGPFTLSENDGYKFIRTISVEKYSDKTQTYAQPGTYLSTLYHVTISVYWPKKGHGDITDCFDNYDDGSKCNFVQVPLVRSNRAY